MKLCTVGHPFNCFNFATLGPKTEHQTREDRFTIDKNSAGAAFAKLAPVLRSGQIQILTQHLEQRLVRGKRNFGFFTVETERDVCLLFHYWIRQVDYARRREQSQYRTAVWGFELERRA